VALDSGEDISFDRLLLATGASAAPLRVAGADLPNVFYLRTLEDADRLHHAIDKARHEGRSHARGRGRVTVIGAGLLGVEVAASLTQIGLGVDLLASKSLPWNRFAGESTGRFLELYLQKHGVTVHAQSRPLRLEGDGRVQRVIIDGEAPANQVAARHIGSSRAIECDFSVACIGAVVNKEFLRGTPISAEKAILVDDRCRTSVADVFAAGDCAAVFDPLFGKHRILDHWDHAIVTGTLAGQNMAGADQPYQAVNYFFSDVFSLSLSAWGEARLVEHRLLRGTPNVEAPDFVEIGIASDGRIAQVLAIGHRGEDELLRRLVQTRFQSTGKEDQLRDPSIPLGSLL
jgi:NADPH-dependent 2,4-dienoyl-CoA reductase/sulfur reductase-like enzyme